MASRLPWTRLLDAVAVTAIACGFVSLYNWVSILGMHRDVMLPALTSFAVAYSRYAYVAPPLTFLSGFSFLRRRDGGTLGLECTILAAWLSALMWILFALWAWQLPRVIIITPAEIH